MLKQPTVTLQYKERQINARLANHFFSRLRGLLWAKPLAKAEAILIMPCNSIHTIGMQYAIDVVFLSADFQVLHINMDCKPKRFFRHKQAKHTLELLAGQATTLGFEVGMQLSVSAKEIHFNRMKI